MPRARRNRLLPFLGLSVALHLQWVLVVAVVMALRPEGCQPDSRLASAPPVDVALLSPDEAARARVAALKRELKETEHEEAQRDRKMEGQVVEIPRPQEEKRPEKARFLSEYDSSVAHQTKAPPRTGRAGASAPATRAAPRASAAAPAVQPPAPRSTAKQRVHPPGELAMRQPDEPPASGPGARAEAADPATEGSSNRERQPLIVPPGPLDSSPGASTADRRLMLSDRDMAAVLGGGGGTNDALTDIDEGESTLLNSKRWRYASFFNRVKRQVAQNWHPDREYRRRDPTGSVHGFKDRLTVVHVTLDRRGELKRLRLAQPSGLGFLDDEAMSAFRLAQPFPNPPPGLVDEGSGAISFNFGFLFELSRSPTFRIFR